ncbi:hypothetical protein [Actinoplanes sp. HUAS TT8]|uniref:hypothetical protein n=1 Tax=Actinoplanes sp. HUAS TT8 TaxID=3447453 RepID=UPI003F51D542
MPTVEERLTRLEELVAEQQELRAGQDKDLSDTGIKVAAQDSLIKAIRETQSEHTAALTKQAATLGRHTEILERHTSMLKNQETEIAWLRLDMRGLTDTSQRMIGMLDTLIERGGQQ